MPHPLIPTAPRGYQAAIDWIAGQIETAMATFDGDPADSRFQADYERGLTDARAAVLQLLVIPAGER